MYTKTLGFSDVKKILKNHGIAAGWDNDGEYIVAYVPYTGFFGSRLEQTIFIFDGMESYFQTEYESKHIPCTVENLKNWLGY